MVITMNNKVYLFFIYTSIKEIMVSEVEIVRQVQAITVNKEKEIKNTVSNWFNYYEEKLL